MGQSFHSIKPPVLALMAYSSSKAAVWIWTYTLLNVANILFLLAGMTLGRRGSYCQESEEPPGHHEYWYIALPPSQLQEDPAACTWDPERGVQRPPPCRRSGEIQHWSKESSTWGLRMPLIISAIHPCQPGWVVVHGVDEIILGTHNRLVDSPRIWRRKNASEAWHHDKRLRHTRQIPSSSPRLSQQSSFVWRKHKA